MPRKVHPADVLNAQVIARATSFRIHLFLGAGRGYATDTAATIGDAKAKAAELLRIHGGHREPLIYGIDPEGRAGIVTKELLAMATTNQTNHEDLGIPDFLVRKPEPKKAAPAVPAKKAAAPKKAEPKPAAAKKAKAGPAPAKKAAAPKKAAASAPRAGSKTETVLKMLKKGATRAAIVEATDGWQVDLKQLAARKGLKLHKDADGVITAK